MEVLKSNQVKFISQKTNQKNVKNYLHKVQVKFLLILNNHSYH